MPMWHKAANNTIVIHAGHIDPASPNLLSDELSTVLQENDITHIDVDVSTQAGGVNASVYQLLSHFGQLSNIVKNSHTVTHLTVYPLSGIPMMLQTVIAPMLGNLSFVALPQKPNCDHHVETH